MQTQGFPKGNVYREPRGPWGFQKGTIGTPGIPSDSQKGMIGSLGIPGSLKRESRCQARDYGSQGREKALNGRQIPTTTAKLSLCFLRLLKEDNGKLKGTV